MNSHEENSRDEAAFPAFIKAQTASVHASIVNLSRHIMSITGESSWDTNRNTVLSPVSLWRILMLFAIIVAGKSKYLWANIFYKVGMKQNWDLEAVFRRTKFHALVADTRIFCRVCEYVIDRADRDKIDACLAKKDSIFFTNYLDGMVAKWQKETFPDTRFSLDVEKLGFALIDACSLSLRFLNTTHRVDQIFEDRDGNVYEDVKFSLLEETLYPYLVRAEGEYVRVELCEGATLTIFRPFRSVFGRRMADFDLMIDLDSKFTHRVMRVLIPCLDFTFVHEPELFGEIDMPHFEHDLKSCRQVASIRTEEGTPFEFSSDVLSAAFRCDGPFSGIIHQGKTPVLLFNYAKPDIPPRID